MESEDERYDRLRSRERSRSRRSRSGSRRHSRSRSRRRSRRSSSGSRSRSVPRGSGDASGQSAEQISLEGLLNKQQEHILDIIREHKEQVDELMPVTRSFKNKGIEKQFNFNNKLLVRLKKVKKLLKKSKVEKALSSVRDLLKVVEDHAEDLTVADSSRHGWLTVSLLRGESDLPTDLLKKVEKIDNRLDKTRPQRDEYRSRKSGQFAQRLERQGGSGGTQTWRQKNQGPEEALVSFSKTKRQGTCSHCTKSGHYYRECPDFWKCVNEGREKESN